MGLPPLPNAKKHWRKVSSDRKKWRTWSALTFCDKRPPAPLQRAKLTLTRHSSSEPDYDGLVASFKSVVDGLVDAKVLVNDKPANIGIPEYRWMYERAKLGRITIAIEEVP